MQEAISLNDFPDWSIGKNGNRSPREVFLDIGGLEVAMPSMSESTASKIANLSFAAVLASSEMKIFEKQQVRMFVKNFAAALAPAHHLLGL